MPEVKNFRADVYRPGFDVIDVTIFKPGEPKNNVI
ncbi:hypothetical protein Brsp06_04594 [Brucella sp. NBRC 13694]|jgi:hypothetical protein